MGMITSEITSVTIVYSTVYSDADQRKHQSSASLAFVRGIHRWPVNSSHKWAATRKIFHLMTSSWSRSWYCTCHDNNAAPKWIDESNNRPLTKSWIHWIHWRLSKTMYKKCYIKSLCLWIYQIWNIHVFNIDKIDVETVTNWLIDWITKMCTDTFLTIKSSKNSHGAPQQWMPDFLCLPRCLGTNNCCCLLFSIWQYNFVKNNVTCDTTGVSTM